MSLSPLSPNGPSVLKLASLFHRDFHLDWLEELTGMRASSILTVLETGVEDGLLLRKGPAVYAFKGPEARAESLAAIPQEDRESYRRAVAEILIRDLPDGDSKALEVADLLIPLKNDWRGCHWLVRAGAVRASAFERERAVDCFRKVVTDLWDQTGEAEDRLFVEAVIGHATNFAAVVDTAKSIAWVKRAKERAKRLKEPALEVLLEMHLARYEWLNSEFEKGLRRFRRAYARVETLGGEQLLRQTSQLTSMFLFWQGRFKDVIETYERSVPDVERHPVGRSSLFASITVGYCYAAVSRLNQGLGLLVAVREHCLERGDRYFAAYASCVLGMTLLSVDRLDDAFRYLHFADKETRVERTSPAALVVSVLLALAYKRSGNKDQAVEHLARFFENWDGSRTVSSLLPPYLAEICWAVEAGELPPVPGVSLDRELDRMLKDRSAFVKGVALRYEALLGQARGLPRRKIARSLAGSVKWLKVSGCQTELAKTQLEFARHYLAAGDERRGRKIMRLASGALSLTSPDLVPSDLRALTADRRPEENILREFLALGPEMVQGRQSRKLLQQIVATANRLAGGERGALFLLDERSPASALQLRASKNLNLEQVRHPAFASSRQVIEEVVRSGQARVLDGTPEEGGASVSEGSIRSGLCVPVLLGGRKIGGLYFDNRLLRNAFKDGDLQLVAYFAALASLELENESAQAEVQRLLKMQEEMEQLDEVADLPEPRRGGLIGVSAGMRRVMADIQRVAATDTAVLILGETGVGKNVVATAIHEQSLRAKARFVTVQCNALAEGLIATELFGHEKGAFTGASERRIGRFELADKGTLFLDEMGDLSLDIQARLLRVLQSKEFERVGGAKEILTSDFRLIAATNRDLQVDVRAKKFREDLYYRINVFPICVPPLRERREDIPLLAQHFLALHAAKQGKRFGGIPQESLDQLTAYDWPGNIRELENVIQRGVISSRSPYFRLPRFHCGPVRTTSTGQFKTLKENERDHVVEALRRAGWKIHGPGGAAELLEINASTLSSRMKKLGISRRQGAL